MDPSAISAIFTGMDVLKILPPNKLNDDPGQLNIPEMICQMMGFPGLVHPHIMHVNPDEVAAALQQGPNSAIWSANVAAQPQHAESHVVHHDTQACVICREVTIDVSSHSVSPNGIDLEGHLCSTAHLNFCMACCPSIEEAEQRFEGNCQGETYLRAMDRNFSGVRGRFARRLRR